MSPADLYHLGLLAGWLSRHREQFEKETGVSLEKILKLIKPNFKE